MLTKTRAVVLRTTKYGEAQLIVDLFTESHGRLSFFQHVAKTGRARVHRQLFLPLAVLDVEFDYRQRANLQRLKNAVPSFPLASVPFEPMKTVVALFLADFVSHVTLAEQQNQPLFLFMENSLRWLDACTGSCANFHLVFMMRITRFIGFFPNLDDEGTGSYFDLRQGCFTAHIPMHTDFLKPDEAGKIRLLMRMNYETMHLFAINRSQRNRCLEIIMHYYQLHVPDFPELRSLQVLREVLA